jgi:hypothetical protein
MSNARIAALEPPYSEPVAAAFDRIMPKGVPPLALFRTLAVNEKVFLGLMAGRFLERGSITLREREIVIDRTCARCGSEYEWGVHVAFFQERARLTEAEISATRAADRRERIPATRAPAAPPGGRASRDVHRERLAVAGARGRVDRRAAHRARGAGRALPPHLLRHECAAHSSRAVCPALLPGKGKFPEILARHPDLATATTSLFSGYPSIDSCALLEEESAGFLESLSRDGEGRAAAT